MNNKVYNKRMSKTIGENHFQLDKGRFEGE